MRLSIKIKSRRIRVIDPSISLLNTNFRAKFRHLIMKYWLVIPKKEIKRFLMILKDQISKFYKKIHLQPSIVIKRLLFRYQNYKHHNMSSSLWTR